jgi:hypothetical protein
LRFNRRLGLDRGHSGGILGASRRSHESRYQNQRRGAQSEPAQRYRCFTLHLRLLFY